VHHGSRKGNQNYRIVTKEISLKRATTTLRGVSGLRWSARSIRAGGMGRLPTIGRVEGRLRPQRGYRRKCARFVIRLHLDSMCRTTALHY